MDKMTSRLAAAALVGGLAVLGAGCAANAAAPAGGHPSSAAAASSALPNPFTILARYSAKSLGLDHPDALAIGPDGNLYVTDGSQRVTVISPAGKVLRRWGKPGTAPGEFKFIGDDPTTPANVTGKITVGRNGMVYVSDSGNDRVQVFSAARKVHPPVRQPWEPEGPVPLPGRPGGRRFRQRLRRGRPEPDPGQVLPQLARSSGRSAEARPATRTCSATSTWRPSTRTAGSSW